MANDGTNQIVHVTKYQRFLLQSALTCAALFSFFSNAEADGVCKTDRIPVDHVAIGEFVSPQCPEYSENPFSKNAWEVDKAVEGVIACELPRPEDIGAVTASLVPCEKTHSVECAPRMDGLPNAIVLRSPVSCISTNSITDIRIQCTNEKPLLGKLELEGKAITEYWPMVAELNSTDCTSFQHINTDGTIKETLTKKNAYIVRRHKTYTDSTTAICASPNNYNRNTDIVVKRFFNENCPEATDGISGQEHGLNAWIIRPLAASKGEKIITCDVRIENDIEKSREAAQRNARVLANRLSQTGGRTTRWKIDLPKPPSPAQSRKAQYIQGVAEPTRHAEQCGGPADINNAYLLSIRTDQNNHPYIRSVE